jgi:hypothetical protein
MPLLGEPSSHEAADHARLQFDNFPGRPSGIVFIALQRPAQFIEWPLGSLAAFQALFHCRRNSFFVHSKGQNPFHPGESCFMRIRPAPLFEDPLNDL